MSEMFRVEFRRPTEKQVSDCVSDNSESIGG